MSPRFLSLTLFLVAPVVMAAESPFPVVTSVAENTAGTQITISGTGFGQRTPKVTLGGMTLSVLSSNNSTVIAQLPSTIGAGTYLLYVQDGGSPLFTLFTAALGQNGPAGPAGPQGLPGMQGPPGAPGLPGAPGVPGAPGATGLPGATGPAGPAGAAGPMGLPGAAGATGPAGATGAAGPIGPIGPAGATGPAGPIGATGATGAAGTTGAAGATGPQGAIGPAGPQGPVGPTGAQGQKGDAGALDPTQLQELNADTAVIANYGADAYAGQGPGNGCTDGDYLGQIILTPYPLFAIGIPADGRLLPIQQYTALFSLIGTTYGGDGRSTFGMPDLRAITPAHMIYSVCQNGIFPSRP